MPPNLNRLERPIPGDRFHQKRASEIRAEERLEREVKTDPVKPHREPRAFGTKVTTNTSTPHPYVPQLIRLRRNPYPMFPVAFKKMPVAERARVNGAERKRESVAAAMAESRIPARESFPKPSEARMRLEARPRPSLAGWVPAGEEGE